MWITQPILSILQKHSHNIKIEISGVNSYPKVDKQQLIQQLKNLFKVDQLIIIPKDPNDFTGHADGMVRFVDDKTVLVNKYSNQVKGAEQNVPFLQ
jgi:agmatine/peptidylarginine deiminase